MNAESTSTMTKTTSAKIEHKSRSELCEVCKFNDTKYTCPRCELRTCSLNCCKIHKLELSCDGQRDKTKFKPIDRFTNLDLLSDYRLMEGIGQAVENSKKNKAVRRSKFPGYLMRLRNEAYKRNTHLRFLPNVFERHQNNKSRYNAATKMIEWTVELVFKNGDDFKILEENVAENVSFGALLQRYLDKQDNRCLQEKLQFYIATGLTGVKLLLKGEMKSKDRYHSLDPRSTIKKCLMQKTILEYPTVFVVLEHNISSFDVIDSDDEDDRKCPAETSKTAEEFIHGIVEKAEEEYTSKFKPQNFLFLSDCSDAE